jgi:CRP-like cAMP-binding protein
MHKLRPQFICFQTESRSLIPMIGWLDLVHHQGIANMSYVRSDNRSFVRNRILASLPGEDFRALKPHLQRVEIKARTVLQEAEKKVRFAHFIEHGLVSRIASSQACSMETAMVGRFGYIGVAIVLGSDFSSQCSVVCLPGTALRIHADKLSRILDDRPQIRAEMLQYVQLLMTQNTQGVLCAAKHGLDQRVARWLLLANDRMQGSALTITHDLLARIMGVRRAGITNTLLQFEAAGILSKRRGSIRLTNRTDLEAIACDCYRIVRDAYVSRKPPRCDETTSAGMPTGYTGKFTRASSS